MVGRKKGEKEARKVKRKGGRTEKSLDRWKKGIRVDEMNEV